MFAQHTVLAIAALASIDAGVTERERLTLTDFLTGRMRCESVPPSYGEPYFTYAQAAKELKVSVPSVKRFVKHGSLVKVTGTGTQAIGVTTESVRNFGRREK